MYFFEKKEDKTKTVTVTTTKITFYDKGEKVVEISGRFDTLAIYELLHDFNGYIQTKYIDIDGKTYITNDW